MTSVQGLNSERNSIMPCPVKSSFKTVLQISLYHIDSHIPFDKKWFSRFKSDINSFWIWAKEPAVESGGVRAPNS